LEILLGVEGGFEKVQGPLLNWNRERERKVEGHFLEKEMREGVMWKNAIFFLWIEEVHEQRGGGGFGRRGRKERGGQREGETERRLRGFHSASLLEQWWSVEAPPRAAIGGGR